MGRPEERGWGGGGGGGMVKEAGVGGAEGVCREQGSSVKVGCFPPTPPPPPTSFLPVFLSSVPLFPLYYPSLDTACFAQPCYDLLFAQP